ncbi:MAG: hypothetical protein Q8Q14_08400 [Gemmatimonadales bacterium]|nr:hypothetical protein [Gemmatimonadales bacterium]
MQARVTLHEQDLHDLDAGSGYALVTAPFRVFQHPAPGGRLVFDVFNPNFAMLTGADGKEHEETPRPEPLPDGRTFYRTYRIGRVRWLDQVSEAELIYYVNGKRYVQAFEMRWYLRAELEHLLARAGFRVERMYGDFARGPVVEGCPDLIVAATPAE